MFINPLKRLFIVKNLVVHKLDLMLYQLSSLNTINQENQDLLRKDLSTLLDSKIEKIKQEQQESIKELFSAQLSEFKQEQQESIEELFSAQLSELKELPLILLSQAADKFFSQNRFVESQKLYELALSLEPTDPKLINRNNLLKKVTKIPLDWSEPKYISPAEAYYPTIPPLNVELSSHCNLKCPYCANATLERDYEKMEMEIIDSIADQCQSLNLKIVALHGVGEPLLRKDLEQILSNLRLRGIWAGALTSNCTLLNLERMKSLYESGLRYLSCSVDTIDPDLYRETRGGNVNQTLENIKTAAINFPDVHFCVALMNHKKQVITPEIEEEFWKIFDNLPNISLSVYENGRFPGSRESWTRYDGELKSEVCQAPVNFLTIDARGKVAVCCADQNTEHILGDVREQSIAEIWFNRENQETFRKIALGLHGCPDVCYKCMLKPMSRTLDSVEPILYAPISEILIKAEEYFLDGNYAECQRLYSIALKRDPYNDELKVKLEEIMKLTAMPDDNYFQGYMAKTYR